MIFTKFTDWLSKNIKYIFTALTLFLILLFFVAEYFYPSEEVVLTSGNSVLYSEPVYWELPDGSKKLIELPGEYDLERGETMTLVTTLPSELNGDALCIRSSWQRVTFSVDGVIHVVYDTTQTRPFGKDSASRFVFCRISEEDAGKEVRIELTSNAGHYTGVVNALYFGDYADIWTHIYHIFAADTYAGFFLVFAGVIACVFSLALAIAYKAKVNLIYLGWCLIFGGAWLISESKMRQIIAPNASLVAVTSFVIIMLAPIPVMLYVNGLQAGRHKRAYAVLYGLSLFNFIFSNALQMTNTVDYLDTMILSHAIMVLTFVLILATFIKDYKSGDLKSYRISVIGICCGIIGTVAEIVSVYLLIYAYGVFLVLGLLAMLFFAIISTTRNIRSLEHTRHQIANEKLKKQTQAMSLQAILTLVDTIEAKSENTGNHSKKVAEYAAEIATNLGWDETDVENLKAAARLHDIGNIGIPDAILNKPTSLLPEEYAIVKNHTVLGAEILKNVQLIPHLEEIARYHHERYDGKGYPEGLSGEDIPLHVRIITLADSLDAMRSRRIYREPLSEESIRAEIANNAGTQFDPKLADLCLKLLEEGKLKPTENAESSLGGILTSFEQTTSLETGKFISQLVNTMKSQQDAGDLDYLTGLQTRNTGEKLMAQSMRARSGCMIFMDMDNLKKINDVYGHSMGDKALRLLGDLILSHIAEDNGIACRLGGDEFLIFLPGVDEENAEKLMQRLFEDFRKEKETDEGMHAASISAGLYMTKKDESFSECYANSDKALYSVKQTGKNAYAFYKEDGEEK